MLGKAAKKTKRSAKRRPLIRMIALVLVVFTAFAVLPGLYASSEDAENNIPPEIFVFNEWNRLYDPRDLKKGTTYSLVLAYARTDKMGTNGEPNPVQLVCADGKVEFVPLNTGIFNYSTSAYTDPNDEKVITLNLKLPYLRYICGETDVEKDFVRKWYNGSSSYVLSYMNFGDLTSADMKYTVVENRLFIGQSEPYTMCDLIAPKREFFDSKVYAKWFLDDDMLDLWLKDYEFGIGVIDVSSTTRWIANVYTSDMNLNRPWFKRYKGAAQYFTDRQNGYPYGYPVMIDKSNGGYLMREDDDNVGYDDLYRASARVWYSTDSYLTKYTGEKYVVTSDAILHLDATTLIDEGTELIIEPGAIVTVNGNLINNGTITNYGTLILEENASVVTETDKGGMGSITCKGVDTKYYKTVNKDDGKGGSKKVKVTLSGEGTVIINDNAKLSLKKDASLSLEKGTTCYNSGYLIIGGGITMNSASLINDGAVSIGYYEKNQSNFEKRGLPVALDGYGYIRGVSDDYSTNFNAQSNYSGAENYVETGEGWYDVSKKIGDSNTVFYDGD